MAHNYKLEAKFPTLPLDTEAVLSDVGKALCGRSNPPSILPVSVRGSALQYARSLSGDEVIDAMHGAVCRGEKIALRFMTAAGVNEWTGAMQGAGFTQDLNIQAVCDMRNLMRKEEGEVELAVSDPDSDTPELSSTKESEHTLTKDRLRYKVQVSGQNIAEATKPPYLHEQRRQRPEEWYYVEIDKHATTAYRM